MATTRPLNDAQDIWVTTFFGGADKGTCFTITAGFADSKVAVSRTFTKEELKLLLVETGKVSAFHRPSFDTA